MESKESPIISDATATDATATDSGVWPVESLLQELVAKIERLENELVARVDRLEARLDSISSSATRMDNHISFVESVYERVKSPFHFLMNSVGRIRLPPRLLDTV